MVRRCCVDSYFTTAETIMVLTAPDGAPEGSGAPQSKSAR